MQRRDVLIPPSEPIKFTDEQIRSMRVQKRQLKQGLSDAQQQGRCTQNPGHPFEGKTPIVQSCQRFPAASSISC